MNGSVVALTHALQPPEVLKDDYLLQGILETGHKSSQLEAPTVGVGCLLWEFIFLQSTVCPPTVIAPRQSRRAAHYPTRRPCLTSRLLPFPRMAMRVRESSKDMRSLLNKSEPRPGQSVVTCGTPWRHRISNPMPASQARSRARVSPSLEPYLTSRWCAGYSPDFPMVRRLLTRFLDGKIAKVASLEG